MRRLFGLHTLLLATVAACSSFAEGRVDSGFDASTDASSEASDDALGSFDAGRDALADAGTDQCVLFDGSGAPPGWNKNQKGAGTVSFAPFDNRNAFEAQVNEIGGSAQLLRNLTIPAGGRFRVTVDLHTSAAPSGVISWIVKLVTITCMAPDSVLQFYLSDGGLYAEISPASGTGSARLAKEPPSSWSTLELDVAGDAVTVSFASTGATLKIASSASYAKLPPPFCRIAVGAAAEGVVPATTVHVARVCVAD